MNTLAYIVSYTKGGKQSVESKKINIKVRAFFCQMAV